MSGYQKADYRPAARLFSNQPFPAFARRPWRVAFKAWLQQAPWPWRPLKFNPTAETLHPLGGLDLGF